MKGQVPMTQEKLITMIEQKRAELSQCVQKHGLTSTTTLNKSQELDSLLNQYNKNRHNFKSPSNT